MPTSPIKQMSRKQLLLVDQYCCFSGLRLKFFEKMEGSLNQTVLTPKPAEEAENPISIEDTEGPKNPFKRLPDDFIICDIFGRICEAKSLCWISLVSKQFSSLVFHTQTVSVKINCVNLPTAQNQVQDVVTTSRFLSKFTSLKSLLVELDYSWNLMTIDVMDKPPLALVAKWKIDSKSNSFVILTAKSLNLATTGNDNDRGNVNLDQVRLLKRYFNCHVEMACCWFKLVGKMVNLLPKSLRNVVVTDSKKEGKLHLGEIDIVRMRKGNTSSATKFGDGEANIRVWHAPFLKLPSSGCLMKMVTLCISKDGNKNDYDDFLIAKEAFDGEADQQVYVEAVMEMLRRDVVSQDILPKQDFSFRLSLD